MEQLTKYIMVFLSLNISIIMKNHVFFAPEALQRQKNPSQTKTWRNLAEFAPQLQDARVEVGGQESNHRCP